MKTDVYQTSFYSTLDTKSILNSNKKEICNNALVSQQKDFLPISEISSKYEIGHVLPL